MIESDYNFRKFILAHEGEDPSELMLRFGGKSLTFDLRFAVMQIACRNRTCSKLRKFINNPDFIFPTALAAEQSSDERVADYHASIVGSGRTVADMTAGLGIDAMTLAMAGNKVTAVEIEKLKADVLARNARVMNCADLKVVNADSVAYLNGSYGEFDYVFIDPARRDNGRRTYFFADCTPDVTAFYKDVLASGAVMLIKSSPILDIKAIIGELESVEKIHVVSVDGECKEVLVELNARSDFRGVLNVEIRHGETPEITEVAPEYIGAAADRYADKSDFVTGKYLYEPTAGMMKMHCARYFTDRFPGMRQAAVNTWLFVSSSLFKDFPGRVLRIAGIPDKKALRTLNGERRCVVTRNYPVGATQLALKLGVNEGMTRFIYGLRAGARCRPIILDCDLIR